MHRVGKRRVKNPIVTFLVRLNSYLRLLREQDSTFSPCFFLQVLYSITLANSIWSDPEDSFEDLSIEKKDVLQKTN